MTKTNRVTVNAHTRSAGDLELLRLAGRIPASPVAEPAATEPPEPEGEPVEPLTPRAEFAAMVTRSRRSR